MGRLPAASAPPTIPGMSQPLDRYFQSAEALSRLQEHAARLTRLQSILARELPEHLVDQCGVANLKGEELVILARGGATAARLKQMVPSLMAAFEAQGVLLRSIRIRVEIHSPLPPRPEVPRRGISADTRHGLADLAAALPGASPLARALRRFVSRSG